MEEIKIFRDGYDIMKVRDMLVSGTAAWRDVFMLPDALVGPEYRDQVSALLEGSSAERIPSGYYTMDEYVRLHPEPSSVRGLRTDGETYAVGEDFPELHVVNGPCTFHGRRSLPLLEAVAGSVYLSRESGLDAPVLSLTGPLTVSEGALLTAGSLTNINGNVSISRDSHLSARSLRYVNGRCDIEDDCTLEVPVLEVVTGSMIVGGDRLALPALRLVNGNLALIQGSSLSAPTLAIVSGSCTLMEGSSLDVPLLASVTGSCMVGKGASLTAPSLHALHQSLTAGNGSRVVVPSLRSVDYDLVLNPGAVLTAPALRSVGGQLSVMDSSQVVLPSLESVSKGCFVGSGCSLDAAGLVSLGHLTVDGNGAASLPSLTSVAGILSVYGQSALDAPMLRTVADGLMVFKSGHLRLPSLESIYGVCCVEENGILDVPKLNTINRSCLLHSDASMYAIGLQNIGGFCHMGDRSVLDAPSLQSAEGYSLKDDSVLNAPLLTGTADHNPGGDVSVVVNPDWDEVLTRLSRGEAGWQELFMLPNSPLFSPDVHSRMAAVMRASRRERFAAGYFTLDEIDGIYINANRIVGITDIGAPARPMVFGEGHLSDSLYPNLRYINGTLQVTGDATVKAPVLEIVGSCQLDSGSKFEAASLKTIHGFCTLAENTNMNAENLTSIGNVLQMTSAYMTASSLASVRSIIIANDSYLCADRLENIKGNCYVMDGSTMIVPGLKNINGDLRINASLLDAPSLLIIGGERKYPADSLNAPLLDSLRNENYGIAGQKRAHDRIDSLKPVSAPAKAKFVSIVDKVSSLFRKR